MTALTSDGLVMNAIAGPLGPDALKEAAKLGLSFEYLDQQEQDRYPSILLYGGNATGKTYTIATAGSRQLIVNIGNGLVTINNPKIKAKFFPDGLPIVTTIREERDPVTGIFKTAEAFVQIRKAIIFAFTHFPDKFDIVTVDDASQLKAFAMNKGLEMNDDLRKSQSLKQSREQEAMSVAIQDYGQEMSLVEQFVNETIDLCKSKRKVFILTAHERHTFKKLQDPTGRVIGEEVDKIRPGFTGKTFPDDIARHFDLVWRMEVLQASPDNIYRVTTEEDQKVNAKSRFPGVFDKYEVSPNIQNAITRIRSSLDGKILPKPSESRRSTQKQGV